MKSFEAPQILLLTIEDPTNFSNGLGFEEFNSVDPDTLGIMEIK